MQTVGNLLVNGAAGVTVGGSSTSVQYFPAVPGASIGVASPNYGFIPVPGSNRANGQNLVVRAVGNAAAPSDGTSPTFTLGLYAVINPTILSNAMNLPSSPSIVTLFTSTRAAAGLGITPFPWRFEVSMNADNASGILQGAYSTQVDGTVVTSTTITSQTGINMNAPIPFALLVGVTFSQASSGNTATMNQFILEQ